MKILVVDDERHITDLVSFRLKSLGYDTETAYDGCEALEKIKVFMPEVVVLDIAMPGMDGYEVCKNIKENEVTEDIKVLFLTAKNTLLNKQNGFNVGAEAYLTKPFHFEELVETIKNLVDI